MGWLGRQTSSHTNLLVQTKQTITQPREQIFQALSTIKHKILTFCPRVYMSLS